MKKSIAQISTLLVLVWVGLPAMGQHFIVLKNDEVIRADSIEQQHSQKILRFLEWPQGQDWLQLTYSQVSHIRYRNGRTIDYDSSGSTPRLNTQMYQKDENTSQVVAEFENWEPLKSYIGLQVGPNFGTGNFVQSANLTSIQDFAYTPAGFAQNGFRIQAEAANFLGPNFGPGAMAAFVRHPVSQQAIKKAYDDGLGITPTNYNTTAEAGNYDMLLLGLGTNLGFGRPKTQWLINGYVGFMSLAGPNVTYAGTTNNPNLDNFAYEYTNGSGVGFFYQVNGIFAFKLNQRLLLTGSASYFYGQTEIEYSLSEYINGTLNGFTQLNALRELASYSTTVGIAIMFD